MYSDVQIGNIIRMDNQLQLRLAVALKLTKLMTSLKWKNILMSLCAQRMKPNPSLSAAITPCRTTVGREFNRCKCKTTVGPILIPSV